jgi:hypothetical protein
MVTAIQKQIQEWESKELDELEKQKQVGRRPLEVKTIK